MYWGYRVPGIRIGEFVNSTSPLMSQYLTSKVIDRIANSE
ncbi:Bone morphogenetic protein receptor type-2, partial [Araneus ventricosus]